MSRRHHTESPEPVSHHHHGGRSRHNKQTTVADVSIASSSTSNAPRPAPAASNPTYRYNSALEEGDWEEIVTTIFILHLLALTLHAVTHDQRYS